MLAGNCMGGLLALETARRYGPREPTPPHPCSSTPPSRADWPGGSCCTRPPSRAAGQTRVRATRPCRAPGPAWRAGWLSVDNSQAPPALRGIWLDDLGHGRMAHARLAVRRPRSAQARRVAVPPARGRGSRGPDLRSGSFSLFASLTPTIEGLRIVSSLAGAGGLSGSFSDTSSGSSLHPPGPPCGAGAAPSGSG